MDGIIAKSDCKECEFYAGTPEDWDFKQINGHHPNCPTIQPSAEIVDIKILRVKRKLSDIECSCIDTASPDTETGFECAGCGEDINWRDVTHGAYHLNDSHYHEYCLFEFLFQEYEHTKM